MGFTIKHSKETIEPFRNCPTYLIYEDGLLIAQYWHDHRGDEHGIDFLNGDKEDWPVGRVIDFLKGGGREPLALSERAVSYLKNKTSKTP